MINTVGWLGALKRELQPFNPDQINIIRTYFHRTGFRTDIISLLAQLRTHLMSISDRELSRKYTEIKASLINYLEVRIFLIKNVRCNEILDPWMAREDEVGLKASLHLHDVLFTCREIVLRTMTIFAQKERRELREFRKNHLVHYIALLPAARNVDAQRLVHHFKKIDHAIKKHRFEKAARSLNKLNELLTVMTPITSKI